MKMNKSKVIRTVVARKTRGLAFMATNVDYKLQRAVVESQVRADLLERPEQFKKIYEQYLYGIKLDF